MPRRKQVSPMQRIDSGEVMQFTPDHHRKRATYKYGNGSANGNTIQPWRSSTPLRTTKPVPRAKAQPTLLSLVICVSGIYTSFLTWGLLQERITATPYPLQLSTLVPSEKQSAEAVEYFRYPIIINTIQALFAFISGSIYLISTTSIISYRPIPSQRAIAPLLAVALCTTLASPFGYASLAHVDYLTFVLAKSCKLLPVMALHTTLFSKRYPLSKYAIVLAVTAGVAIFTLYQPAKPGKSHGAKATSGRYMYGLSLLGLNLLFDGFTNTLQDHIFSSPQKYTQITGQQMMVSSNLIGFALSTVYLLLTPLIPSSLLPSFIPSSATTDLTSSLAFISRHPGVLQDILGFCVAGAIGQLFIFATLERFSSLVLVTVTVTRKMLTMVLSVVWYGKRLAGMQWIGVCLVFGGVVVEGWIGQREKERRRRVKEAAMGKSR